MKTSYFDCSNGEAHKWAVVQIQTVFLMRRIFYSLSGCQLILDLFFKKMFILSAVLSFRFDKNRLLIVILNGEKFLLTKVEPEI